MHMGLLVRRIVRMASDWFLSGINILKSRCLLSYPTECYFPNICHFDVILEGQTNCSILSSPRATVLFTTIVNTAGGLEHSSKLDIRGYITKTLGIQTDVDKRHH